MNRTIYEFLPTLYVFAGFLSTLAFDYWPGRFAGAVLILAGVFVFNARLVHRSR